MNYLSVKIGCAELQLEKYNEGTKHSTILVSKSFKSLLKPVRIIKGIS